MWLRSSGLTVGVLLVTGTLAAQTPATGDAKPAGEGETTSRTAEPAPASPLDHLTKAKAALEKIDEKPLAETVRPRLGELKKKFATLDDTYRSGGTKAFAQEERRTGTRITITQTTDWSAQVEGVDRLVSELLRPGTADTPAAVPDTLASRLREFRKHLTAFAAAATGSIGGTPATVTPPTSPAPAPPPE